MKINAEELILLLTVFISGEPRKGAKKLYKKLKKQVDELKKETANDTSS